MAIDAERASELIERFQQAVIDYERAYGESVPPARKAEADARKALFNALTGGSDA